MTLAAIQSPTVDAAQGGALAIAPKSSGINLGDIEWSIAERLGTDATADACAEVICTVDAAIERLKNIRAMLDASLFEHIHANGDLTIGTVRYYIGTPKKTKCRDTKAALEQFLAIFDGDLRRIAECLASNAWKHGQAREFFKIIQAGDSSGQFNADEVFNSIFEVTEDEELCEGKPVKAKKLQTIDERFIR